MVDDKTDKLRADSQLKELLDEGSNLLGFCSDKQTRCPNGRIVNKDFICPHCGSSNWDTDKVCNG